jgi:hypothetical protein
VIRRLLVICLFGAFLMVAVAPAQPNGGTSGKRGGFLFIGTDAVAFKRGDRTWSAVGSSPRPF